MIADLQPGSKDDEELELLAFLIADYESCTVKIPAVTPAEAIRFRMEPTNDYRKHCTLIGQGKVKELFDLP